MRLKIIFISIFASVLTAGNKLDLSWRGLTKEKFFRDVNGSVSSQVEKATELNLRGNFFDNFIDCSAKLDHLEVLDLSQNKLEKFFFLCNEKDNLFKLNVSHNKLTFLNDSGLNKQLSKLQVLDLSHNLIEDINQETFQHMENVHFLALNANPIGNNIANGAFRKLKSLKELNLSNIGASNFSKDLFTPLITLKHLSLASNPLKDLPALPIDIEELDISGTNITQLENIDFPHLKVLVMNSMPNLVSLDFNQLRNLRRLTFLSIENSPKLKKLTLLPPRDDLLPNLKRISLRNGSIDKLGIELKSILHKTTLLDLQDNPWHCDCGMRWILSPESTMDNHDHMRCETPLELRGKRVFEIPVDQFYCDRINYLALWISLGILGFATIVITVLFFARGSIRQFHTKSRHGETVAYKNMTPNSKDREKILDQADIIDYL